MRNSISFIKPMVCSIMKLLEMAEARSLNLGVTKMMRMSVIQLLLLTVKRNREWLRVH